MKPAGRIWKKDFKLSKRILEAFNEDGSIEMELLKGISRGCLEGLNERHAQGKCQYCNSF